MSNHPVSRVARATQQTPGLDGPAFPSSRERTDLSLGGDELGCPRTCPERNEVADGQKNHGGVPITALLLVVTWRPSANYQLLLHLVVCAGATMVILALVFIKHRIEIRYSVK